MLNQKHIRRRFERAASGFDDADFVHSVTRQGLVDRLLPLLVDVKTVIDLGSATGRGTPLLEKRFKKASVISVDLANAMLKKARRQKSWFSRASCVQANAASLPFADGSIDVIYANQVLPWVDDLSTVFTEVARVLRKGGLFAFATLGPDSFREIARAWRSVDDGVHVHSFPDMHDLGDALVNAGLGDPVLDVDRLNIAYSGTDKLLADLTSAGARNALIARMSGLTSRHRFDAMLESLQSDSGDISLDLELVFGHCWGAGPKSDPRNYRIDADQIPIRRT